MISSLFKCHKYLQASGANFPMASQMNELQWDVEQEFMSSLQVKTCVSHDPCKNTCKNDKFLKFYNFQKNNKFLGYNSSFFNVPMFAGQNIYYESTYAPQRPPLESTVTNAVFAWYNEIIVAPTSEADYVQAVPGREIGHFLTISHDQTQRVGCTGSQYEKLDKFGINRFTQITCNFDKAPFLTLPLYKKGETCTGCPGTCDMTSDSPGLCIVNPKSFANTYYF